MVEEPPAWTDDGNEESEQDEMNGYGTNRLQSYGQLNMFSPYSHTPLPQNGYEDGGRIGPGV